MTFDCTVSWHGWCNGVVPLPSPQSSYWSLCVLLRLIWFFFHFVNWGQEMKTHCASSSSKALWTSRKLQLSLFYLLVRTQAVPRHPTVPCYASLKPSVEDPYHEHLPLRHPWTKKWAPVPCIQVPSPRLPERHCESFLWRRKNWELPLTIQWKKEIMC